MVGKKKGKDFSVLAKEVINKGVGFGISSLVKAHPRFKGYESYLNNHLDRRKIGLVIDEAYHSFGGKDLKKEKKLEILYKEVANYVSSGFALDEEAGKILLKKGLEEKAEESIVNLWKIPRTIGARRRLKGEKYLDRTLAAFNELYEVFKQGDYSKKMPDIAESLETVKDMGFLAPAKEILMERKIISNKDYNQITKSIDYTTRKSVENVIGGIKKYSGYKIAAFILGILGIFSLVVSNISNVTGAVVGNSGSSESIIGILLLIVSLGLFLFIRKKT